MPRVSAKERDNNLAAWEALKERENIGEERRQKEREEVNKALEIKNLKGSIL